MVMTIVLCMSNPSRLLTFFFYFALDQAYIIYLILITLQLFNKIASVLLYALMSCIYATLLGVVVYFCPQLLSVLRSSSIRNRGLTTRLSIATTVCVLVFAAHAIDYARLVVAPPRKVYWWWQYGTSLRNRFKCTVLYFQVHWS
jgi:hypothetical protein